MPDSCRHLESCQSHNIWISPLVANEGPGSQPDIFGFHLFDNGANIWQILFVLKGRQPGRTHNSIQLFMSFLDYPGVRSEPKDQRIDRHARGVGSRLTSIRSINNLPQSWSPRRKRLAILKPPSPYTFAP